MQTTDPTIPEALRRADYVSRLARLGWWIELGDKDQTNFARDEEAQLRLIRAEIDPDGALWNRHAPPSRRDEPVHTFRDFTGRAPVVVEWVQRESGPKVTAVVVETTAGAFGIHDDLNAEVLARYQAKCEQIARGTK